MQRLITSATGRMIIRDNKIVQSYADVGARITQNTIVKRLFRKNFHTGLQIRNGSFRGGNIHIQDCACDSVQSFTDNWHIQRLSVVDMLEYEYSEQCHKDVIQMFRANHKPYSLKKHQAVDKVYLGYLNARILNGTDKGAIIVSEIGGISNSTLFDKGVVFTTSSENPYFFSACRVENLTLGSDKHPIDADKISGKAIRLGDIKKGARASCKSIVHVQNGVEVILGMTEKKVVRIVRHLKEI